MERECNPSRLHLKKKPRMYWGEPRYEGYNLVIYPRRGIYSIGNDIFPLKTHSENRSYRRKPRMYFGKPRIAWETRKKAA